jgi:hypothetical protein
MPKYFIANIYYWQTALFDDKADNFNFSIVNVPYLYSMLPLSHAYGVYIRLNLTYTQEFVKQWLGFFFSKSRNTTDKVIYFKGVCNLCRKGIHADIKLFLHADFKSA